MNPSSIAIWILLAIAMAAFLVSAAGITVRNVFDRIQFGYPAATTGILAIVAAILVHRSFSNAGWKAIFTGLVVVWTNPVIAHATARAARVRRLGRWKPSPHESIDRIPDQEREAP